MFANENVEIYDLPVTGNGRSYRLSTFDFRLSTGHAFETRNKITKITQPETMSNKPSSTRLLSAALQRNDAELMTHVFELPGGLIDKEDTTISQPPDPSKFAELHQAVSKISSSSDLITSDWKSLLQHTSSLRKRKSFSEAFDIQRKIHSLFNATFSSSSGNWLVPTLHVVCRNTFHLACKADGDTTETNKELAVTSLQESFSRTINDRTKYNPNDPFSTTASKKCGVLAIVNILLKAYFRLNKLRLCKNLLNPVELHSLHKNSGMVQRIIYNYYIGRLHLFEDNFERAEECLDFCMANESNPNNKRRILNFLVPVKLLRGRLPSRKLLEKYSMQSYMSLISGVKIGNLSEFSNALESNSKCCM